MRPGLFPVFHWMDETKALAVLTQDEMQPSWVHHVVELRREVAGSSFSRNSRLVAPGRPVRLVADRQLLGVANRIVVLDGNHAVFHQRMVAPQSDPDEEADAEDMGDDDLIPERIWAGETERTDEEFVLGAIRKLSRTLLAIDLRLDLASPTLVDEVRAYAERHDIRLREHEHPAVAPAAGPAPF